MALTSVTMNIHSIATYSHNLSSTPALFPPSSFSPSPSSSLNSYMPLSSSTVYSKQLTVSHIVYRRAHFTKNHTIKVICARNEPLKVMISGAPASGKGTQCELIVQKFGLVHISTGDLLRAEVSAGSDIGNKANEYMNSGRLVPDEIVTAMVTARLSREDAKEKGWLLDGYPRTLAQAESLERLNIRPDIYIVLDVPDEILIDRCVGRRLDPLTGRIYHVTNFPPETEDVKARLITRPDDTEEKAKSRLQIYKQNAEAILPVYSNIMNKVDGNRSKDAVFEEIDSLLAHVQKEEQDARKLEKSATASIQADKASLSKDWRGIPTRLNNIPHSREIREYFYTDVLQATQRAVNDGKTRLKIEISIPELNPATDVYRIGTLMELVRVLALSFADDGKRVKVCVQGSMGEGSLAGMPLQLAGSRKILEYMDWGDYGALGTFVNIGSIGAKEVEKQDDLFILVAPQNAVGNCIIDDMKAMTDAAGNRPVILLNPKLKDLPGSSGIMQTMGRDKRLEYAASFEICYSFRLLYYAGTQYPIMGALRMSYPYPYELYKRVDESPGKEKYMPLVTFPKRPSIDEMNNAFEGKSSDQVKKAGGIWGFVEPSTVAIKERFGKYQNVLQPGCHCVPWFLGDQLAGHLSLRVQQLDVRCGTMTKDGVFVNVVLSVYYRVMVHKANDAFYELSNPKGIIQGHVSDVIRSIVPTLSVDVVFGRAIKFAGAVKEELEKAVSVYGFTIVQTLVIAIELDERVKKAIIEKNAAARIFT